MWGNDCFDCKSLRQTNTLAIVRMFRPLFRSLSATRRRCASCGKRTRTIRRGKTTTWFKPHRHPKWSKTRRRRSFTRWWLATPPPARPTWPATPAAGSSVRPTSTARTTATSGEKINGSGRRHGLQKGWIITYPNPVPPTPPKISECTYVEHEDLHCFVLRKEKRWTMFVWGKDKRFSTLILNLFLEIGPERSAEFVKSIGRVKWSNNAFKKK